MKYIIKNKLVSLGGSSTVRDEAGNDLFLVKGRVFSFTRHKSICDLEGNPLYRVRNKFFHIFLPKVFLMDKDGNILVTIKKRSLFSFRQNFDFICAEGSNLNISLEGDFIGRHYDILENGIPVAHVRRNFNLVKDSFWLETDFDEKAALYISIVIAVDNYYDKLMQEASSD